MGTILHIDCSPRVKRSHSRRLAQEFIDGWLRKKPGEQVVRRDLGTDPVPHVDEAWVTGVYAPPEEQTEASREAMRRSDELIDEFAAATCYVLSTPMYNLGVPSTLKAYIDQIVRPGRTFEVKADGLVGLLHGKSMLVITSRGGVYAAGSALAAHDFQEPFLRAVFGTMGITDIEFVNAEGMDWGPEMRQRALASASARLQECIAAW